jgi:sodium-dependent phosphate cotransporter
VHIPQVGIDRPRWVTEPTVVLRGLVVVFLLYVFLVGIGFLESGITAMGEGFENGLLESVSHPLAGLFAGILATVLVQSSSITTATIVGLVGTGTLPVPLAVPMIMGANIGTTVTNTLAALTTILRSDEFRRGFACATHHDFFNLMAAAIILPIELATGFLHRIAAWMTVIVGRVDLETATPARSPIRVAVGVPVDLMEGVLGIGVVAGVIYLVLGLTLLFFALTFITRTMRGLMAGGMEKALNQIIERGGSLLGIVAGILITVAVQSSSITTSILVPLVASGVLHLTNAYPITVGANVGTTVTALIASLAVARPEGLTIALVHLLFNISAITIIFPVYRVRMLPIYMSEWFADLAVRRHSLVFAYVVGVFFVIPILGVLLLK